MRKNMSAFALGILGLAVVMGAAVMTATSALAGDSSPSEIAWQREFLAQPYVEIPDDPVVYRTARIMEQIDDIAKVWDEEFLAQSYVDMHYSHQAMQQATERAMTLERAR